MSHSKKGVFAFAAVACLFGFEAVAATIYYVPSETPYLWTDACWYQDSAGTTATNAPGSADIAYLGASALKNNTLTVPSGTAASVDSVQLRQEGMTLAIDDGALFTTKHTTIFSKANNTCLRVMNGGSYTASSFIYLGDSTRKNARLLVDEGGTANFNNQVTIGNASSTDSSSTCYAYLENHGTVSFGKVMVLVGKSSGTVVSKGVIDNYGTINTTSTGSKYVQLGTTAGDSGYFTNRVNATANINHGFLVGTGTNGTGIVVNDGTMNISKPFSVGGDNVASDRDNITSTTASTGTVLNNGTMVLKDTLTLGGHKYGKGTVDNHGTMTVAGTTTVAARQRTTGKFSTHSDGVTTFNGSLVAGYYGIATLTLNGKTYVTNSTVEIASKNGSTGTVNLVYGGRLYGNRKGLKIVAGDGTSPKGVLNLSSSSKYEKPGTISMGVGTGTVAELNLTDSAVLDSPNAIVVGMGSSAVVSDGQRAMLSLAGTSKITSLSGDLNVATNVYGRGEVVVADEAEIIFAPTSCRNISLAKGSASAQATLTLRGGSITMTTNSILYVGRHANTENACNGFVRGWGRLDRHSPELTTYQYGITMDMGCGALTADGEGVERDLDLSMIRKIFDNGLNKSGTNGWYAVNKGRLTYPCRFGGYRMLGDYYGHEGDPVYVNSVSVDCTDKKGYLIGQLYATDRSDIPAGLPADDIANRVKRLGVWRATINANYDATNVTAQTRGNVTSATIKIRYNNFLLNELADAEGAFDGEQTLVLYAHDGSTDGTWRRIKTVSVNSAEEGGHLIGGTIQVSPEPWNLGFFAVVAEPKRGLAVLIR